MIAKNNPYNLRWSSHNHWLGQNGQCRGFCTFESEFYATRAFILLIRTYFRRRHARDVVDVLQIYAPSCENDTDTYIRTVLRIFNIYRVSPLIEFSVEWFSIFCAAVQHVEIGRDVTKVLPIIHFQCMRALSELHPGS